MFTRSNYYTKTWCCSKYNHPSLYRTPFFLPILYSALHKQLTLIVSWALLPSELLGNVGLDDGKLVHGLEPVLRILHLLVLLEMLNVLGMRQILELGILVVVLFPVVNLVLVLVVTVVAGTGAQIRQRLARPDEVNPFLSANREVAIRVQKS